jgi:hypothetical protein
MYYREALAIGLDRDDWFLRQHLRRKLLFLKEDAALDAEPNPEELEAHLAQNREEFAANGASPPVDQVRAGGLASWIDANRREATEGYPQELRRKYIVRVKGISAGR